MDVLDWGVLFFGFGEGDGWVCRGFGEGGVFGKGKGDGMGCFRSGYGKLWVMDCDDFFFFFEFILDGESVRIL